jgi:preprotein translocase subunit SecD
MKTKAGSTIVLVIVLAIIAALTYTTFFGIQFGHKEVDGETVPNYIVAPISAQLKYGLDLTGGVYTLLEAKDDPKDPVDDEKINRAITMINQRINALGVSEPVITRQGDRRIMIELPGVEDKEEAIARIGRTAQLKFVDPNDNIILTGNNVIESVPNYYTPPNSVLRYPIVSLKLDAEGTAKFAEATKEFKGKIIKIMLDDEVISDPIVNDEITTGEAMITGQRTIEEANDLAMLIRAGALPVELEEVQTVAISATLGADALQKSIRAGVIGIILVFLFMVAYYKVPGLIASIALMLYTAVVLGTLSSIGAVLTLPGIAGLILSIGMAVDANVIIFERLKEELKSGKTLRPAIDSAFSRAFRAILDSNVTTIIAGIVLYNFGTGPIKGFALTLMIGIVISMLTAIFITKYLLKQIARTNLISNLKLFGQ